MEATTGHSRSAGRRRGGAAGTLLSSLMLAGCSSGGQSMLDTGGPMAEAIAGAWWIMLAGAIAILALVMVLALYAVYRQRGRRRPIHTDRFILVGGLLFPTVTLTALLAYGMAVSVPGMWAREGRELVVEVTGHQWWWEVRYPGTPVVTANEIHIPAGRPVRFELKSADVIHSFWVPNLGGKMDMIPGRINRLVLEADTPGDFRGQCAEFCGAQHARMAFRVRAHPPEAFEEWLARRRAAAAEPDSPAARRGRREFIRQGCPECHTIRGTVAQGRTGPDLTHVASRRYIAAGTLRNTPANLARWLADNQRIKPGNRMADFSELDPAVVDDLVSYLETLQ